MMNWYDFTPQDTLFFRGAEPAVMGESHAASMIFPPPAHTIAGAMRTAWPVRARCRRAMFCASAMVAVVLTHVPGGTGVFELVILNASNTSHPQAVIAALLCFRVIYFFIPLLFVAAIFLIHEIQIRRGRKTRVSSNEAEEDY